MNTNKIEKALLDKELKVISESLNKIGAQIQAVFSKYGDMEGAHIKELHEYIAKHIAGTNFTYLTGGGTTAPKAETNPDHIPECIKELILEWAVKDFFENLEGMKEIIEYIE